MEARSPETKGPLSGLRVIDLGQFMAGPMAAMWLGDYGADVIKIEHPRGDGFRHWA
jgi:crotonobetainyl-CoA:carnitine CoA-transferase CaiB-like acyl-CoA transferase